MPISGVIKEIPIQVFFQCSDGVFTGAVAVGVASLLSKSFSSRIIPLPLGLAAGVATGISGIAARYMLGWDQIGKPCSCPDLSLIHHHTFLTPQQKGLFYLVKTVGTIGLLYLTSAPLGLTFYAVCALSIATVGIGIIRDVVKERLSKGFVRTAFFSFSKGVIHGTIAVGLAELVSRVFSTKFAPLPLAFIAGGIAGISYCVSGSLMKGDKLSCRVLRYVLNILEIGGVLLLASSPLGLTGRSVCMLSATVMGVGVLYLETLFAIRNWEKMISRMCNPSIS